MSPQVSVIIPVYNTARYLSRCCESLFRQTLQSIEYIFVDDASTDDSGEAILQVLANYPDRIHQTRLLTHEVHQGVSAARQHGLEIAKGEYVIHCDSDDWVEPSMYERLYKEAKASQADVVTCGYVIESTKGVKYGQVSALLVETGVLPFSISPQTGALWNKLVRRQLILEHQLQFPVNISWGEDLCFSLKTLMLSSKTARVDLPLYHYVQQEESLTHDITPTLVRDLLKCGHVIESFLHKQKLFQLYEFQLNWLKFQLKQYLLLFPETRDVDSWRTTYPECDKYILRFPSPLYLKVVSWLIVHRCTPVASFLLQLKDCLSSHPRA